MDAAFWDERYRSTDRLWSKEPNIFVADRLSDAQPGVGIDLAGGEGRNAIWMASRGWSMTVVDFSQAAVERGRQSSPEISFVVADVTQWQPDQEVDLVLIAYLQVFASELERVVKRAQDWLVPGGELFMVGHDRSNIDEGHGGPQDPERLWDLDQIRDWVEGDLIESTVVRRPVETEDGAVYALDTLLRVRRAL